MFLFLKKSTEHMKKIPTIILSITYKGVKFIDASNKVSFRCLDAGVWKDGTCSPRGCRSHFLAQGATWAMGEHQGGDVSGMPEAWQTVCGPCFH